MSPRPALEEVLVPAGGEELPGLLARPPAAALASEDEGLPAVLLLCDAVSAGEEHARGWASRFASEGFLVLLPHSSLAAPRLADRRALALLDAAAAWLGERPEVDGGRLAAVGCGRGGTLAFLLGCTSTRVAAVVAYAARLRYEELSAQRPIQPLELALNLDRPLLAVFEEAGAVPAEEVEALRATLAAAAKDFEIVQRDGQCGEQRGGGADCSAAAPPGPAPAVSAGDAWHRTLEFLRARL